MLCCSQRKTTYSFPKRSSFPSSPSRSAVSIQIVRARLRVVWIKRDQYFRPSAHLQNPLAKHPWYTGRYEILRWMNQPLIGRRTAKRQSQSNHEPQYRKQDVIDADYSIRSISNAPIHPTTQFSKLTVLDKSRNACDQCRPKRNREKRQDQFGQNTSMHTHEDGPFGMFIEVTGTMLKRRRLSPLVHFHPVILIPNS